MRNADAARRRRRPTSLQRPFEHSHSPGRDDDERDLRWELRGPLHAVLQELEARPVDWDACETILRGAVEAIEVAAA